MAYIAAQHANEPKICNIDEAQEISRLQKELSNQITKSIKEEKECVRIQEKIKHLQNHHQIFKWHFTSIECAYVAIGTGGPSLGEVSVTDSGGGNWRSEAKRIQ